jgi:hypothetical protein
MKIPNQTQDAQGSKVSNEKEKTTRRIVTRDERKWLALAS